MLREPDGKAKFLKYYGDYYVKGCVNGASMRLVIRTSFLSQSTSMDMDLAIKGGFNAGFFSLGGGGGFSMALQSSNT